MFADRGKYSHANPCNDQEFRTQNIWYVKIILCVSLDFADKAEVCGQN